MVRIEHTASHGNVLFTKKGFALYTYAKDTRNHSNCNGSCLALWPILTLPKGLRPVGQGVSGLKVMVRPNGVRQVTYKGWPLYTYVKDTKRGVVRGNAVGSFHVAKVTLKAAKSASRGSSSGSSSGW